MPEARSRERKASMVAAKAKDPPERVLFVEG
jgi:hypothetical protein